MIITLAWKEVREHQPVWLTMVIMTVVLAKGLTHIVGLCEIWLEDAPLILDTSYRLRDLPQCFAL